MTGKFSDDGLVRFSTEKYSLNTKNRYVHLTNYSINKKSKKFESNQDAGAATGHKWSMKILWAELQKAGYDTDKIWTDIKGKRKYYISRLNSQNENSDFNLD